jgi:hypothetical protein
MGEFLKIDYEVVNATMLTLLIYIIPMLQMIEVDRGGITIKIVKNVAFQVPIIPIGDLDEYGKDLLDAMLEGLRNPIIDIVEFFKNYEPPPGKTF